MKHPFFLLMVIGMLAFDLSCAPSSSVDSAAAQLVGSWRLVSWTNADGSPRCTSAEGQPSGQIIYSAEHMSAQLGCAQAPVDTLERLSAEELATKLNRKHLSYYGTVSVDEAAQTVTHHVMGSSILDGFTGSDQVRSYTFETTDRLVLQPPSGGVLVWNRN